MKNIKYDRFVIRDPNAPTIEPLIKIITIQKGQITIPSDFMQKVGWEVGTRVEIVFTPRYIVLRKHWQGVEIQKANSNGTGALYIGEIRQQITANTGEPGFIPQGQVRCVCDLQNQEIVFKQENTQSKEKEINKDESKNSKWCIYHSNKDQSRRPEEAD